MIEFLYKALRESVINALIHRNYLGSSTIRVRVYNDRITFLNEGKLPPEVPVEKLKTEHLSKPRNKLLAERDLRELVEKKVFKQYGTKGQGIS